MNRLIQGPWWILPAQFDALLMRAARFSVDERLEHDGQDGLRVFAARPENDVHGDPFSKLEMRGSVGLVTIDRPLLKGARGSDKYYFGVLSHEDVAEDLDAAVAQGARSILLNMDSPGGTVAGTPELASKIAGLRKQGMRVYSYAGTMSASAAEYVSAPAEARFAAGSAMVGSIGTRLDVVNISKMLEKFGVQWEVITSGKYKATGHPAVPLSDDQRAYLQDMVSAHAAEFQAHMKAWRPGLGAEHMQGQVFTGKEAARIGLVDDTADSLEEVLGWI